ncbi:hypothetical protein BGAL_0454g00050 [Botrytis galanthina]|uniref:Uncharacterized protein n=1 Tax=Botrytis galanthina TaxID=278940 RepID=A0A4S8QW08_9HELO|nr:hypothetical protein BGAL_0454g00050 [Botrytis galanthina]
MNANENLTESSSHLTHVVQGRFNPINSDNTEQVTLASRKDRQRKPKSREAQDLHRQEIPREVRVSLPPNWETKYPQYTYKAGASFKPPHTFVKNAQDWLMVRLKSNKGHRITAHPLDWEEFKANEKDGHRLLTRAINFIQHWDQCIKDNPKDLKNIDRVCASWVASSCAGDNPYGAKVTVGDPRLLGFSARHRQLQRKREKKRQHMEIRKRRQESPKKLSVIENQIEELILGVSRHQLSEAISPPSNLP